MRALSEQRVQRQEQRVLQVTFNPERVLGGAAKLIVVLSLLQVMDWIENHGEAFLSKHTGVGKSLHRARALQKRHDDFEDVAQVSLYVFNTAREIHVWILKKVCYHREKDEVSSLFFIKRLLSCPANICKQSALINTKFSKPQCLLVAGSTKTCLYVTIYGHKPFLKDLQKLLFIPEFQSFRKKKNPTGTEVSLVKMKTKQRNWNWTSWTCFVVAYNTALRITKTWVTENLHQHFHIHLKLSDVDGMSQKRLMLSEDVSCLISLVLKSSKYLSVCQSSALDTKQTEKSSNNIVCVQNSQILTVLLRLKRRNTHTHT